MGGVNNNMLWIVPAGVYINSVNYWRNPVGGMRRRIDIGWTVLGLMINNVYAIRYSTNAYPYFIITLLACLMYPLSYYFYWRKCNVYTLIASYFCQHWECLFISEFVNKLKWFVSLLDLSLF